jgi:hypothetical protein
MYSLNKSEYRIFKPVEITIMRILRRKKKNRGDKPIRVIMHIYMEMLQGNSLYSYLKQKYHFIFLLQNYRSGGRNRYCLGQLLPMRGERMWRKGVRG